MKEVSLLAANDAVICPDRCVSIDYLRLAAAVGIVWFHVMEAPGRVIAYAALPVFVILTLMLPLLREEPLSMGRSMRRRAWRLLLPWAVWYAVYAAFAVRGGRPIVEEGDLGNLLYGPALHLWFLPFAFVAGIAAEWVGPKVLREPTITAVLAPVVGSVLVWLAVAHLDHLDDPWVQFALAGSFAPFAVGLAAAHRIADANLRRNALALTALLPAVTATGIWHAGIDWHDALSTALGVAAVAIVLCIRLPASHLVRQLATLTMGVYLIHPIAFWGVYDIASRPSWWMLLLGGVGGATAASAILSIHPWSRRLFFGEISRGRTTPVTSTSESDDSKHVRGAGAPALTA